MSTGEAIEREFGIPIVNKRISVTPIALVAGALRDGGLCPLRRRRWTGRPRPCGVNFIGGFSALVQKGMTEADWQAHRAPFPRRWPPPSWCAPPSTWAPPRRASTWTPWRSWAETIKDTAEPHRRPGRLRLRQAGGILQRGGGQPLHGRCLPRRGRGRDASSTWAFPAPAWCTTPSRP